MTPSVTSRDRCASALAHHITIASLLTLLVNDLVFKSLWPDTWVTGKLSDFAWMIFAPPLLGFLLSHIVPSRSRTETGIFVTAYVVLPLAYAAFNTFPEVHTFVIGLFTPAMDSSLGSPRDPTDSLMIPFGLGVAFWIWRREPSNQGNPNRSYLPVIAALAALATIATSAPLYVPGVTRVGTSSDGAIVAFWGGHSASGAVYSRDGGMTWAAMATPSESVITWGGTSAIGPRGTYRIDGSEIVLIDTDEQRVPLYSAAYLRRPGNRWMQQRATEHLGDGRVIATSPGGLVFDANSGNVIAALGLQGVVIGTPEGEWARVGIGDYSPTEFSFLAKSDRLISQGSLWNLSLTISLSALGITLFVVKYRWLEIGPTVVAADKMAQRRGLLWATLFAATPCFLSSFAVLGLFDASFSEAYVTSQFFQVMCSVVVYLTGSFLVLWNEERLRYWKAILLAFFAMNGSVVLCLMWWLHLGLVLIFAKGSAILLIILISVALGRYVQRQDAASI